VLNVQRTTKKEEFLTYLEKIRPGTPFPRSALFLETVCAKVNISTWSKLLTF